MRLAIMQPYFFPYIGYWQLINTVDRFVIYDDVSYIKGGWVNRNRILINGKPSYITIPLHQASANKRICDIYIQDSLDWRKKMIKSVQNTYRKAPFFTEVFPVIEKIISNEASNLSDYTAQHLRTLAAYLEINTEFVITSRCYKNNNLKGQDRVIDICKREGAATYINSQGGKLLYDTEAFNRTNIDLRFITMRADPYKQRSAKFVPYLSIIDALMELGPIEVMQNMNEFEQC